MAGNIRLSPEELRDVARRYGIESGNVQQVVGTLDGMRDHLNQVWEGNAKEAFIAQYEELRVSFVQMVELLEGVNHQLASTAQTLEDTDTQIAGQIRS
ncbi:WXG100 family type VII secretion target [Virgibacillus necropolis]|uniref:ESAT-6-like protein n=1 Tax=Virgibacillus necropolis TaxID=163877 RepID=A0A221MEL2_9BACI|nr:WXG100 family type VII secretion target [Virgibacillus necropolis]ASN06087.1 WXG100 family type VII secretion target [Virgibacillus necropolis]